MVLTDSIKQNEIAKKIWGVAKRIFPYLVILVASILPFWIWMFGPGLPGGDDAKTHLAWIYDIYYGFTKGFFVGSTNHLFLGNFAYNTYSFYAPIPHYAVAILFYCLKPLGASLIGCLVFISILCVFLSGIFFFLLAKRIIGNNSLPLALSILYTFFPYRLFCFVYRFAFNEAIALCFFPVLFYGLYRILHDQKLYVAPYIIVIVSFSGMVLSHPFTALLGAGSALVYLIFNIKRVISLFKGIHKPLYLLTSCLLIIGMVSFFVFPLLVASNSSIYIVSDREAMWATLQHLLNQIPASSSKISGFINFYWLSTVYHVNPCDAPLLWGLGLALFPLSCCAMFFFERLASKEMGPGFFKGLIRVIVSLVILFAPSLLANQRVEIIMGLGVFALLYFGVFYFLDNTLSEAKVNLKEAGKELLRDPEVYCCLFLIIISLLYIYTPFMWQISPSILYYAQFPFRFWGVFSFFLCFLSILIFKPFSKKRSVTAFAFMLASFFLPLNQGMIDKRISTLENNLNYFTVIDEEFVKEMNKEGSQNEYCPKILVDIYLGKATVSYPNSLAKLIGSYMDPSSSKDMLFGEDEYITPIFLNGEGGETVKLSFLNTPEVSFAVTTTKEETLIQIPQLYYDGYQAVATYSNGDVTPCKVSNIDGLVAASIPQGTYELSFSYKGTSLKRSGYIVAVISSIGLLSFGVAGFLIRKKKEQPVLPAS